MFEFDWNTNLKIDSNPVYKSVMAANYKFQEPSLIERFIRIWVRRWMWWESCRRGSWNWAKGCLRRKDERSGHRRASQAYVYHCLKGFSWALFDNCRIHYAASSISLLTYICTQMGITDPSSLIIYSLILEILYSGKGYIDMVWYGSYLNLLKC